MSSIYLACGSRHFVYKEGNHVIKVPHCNEKISIARAQESINFFNKHIPNFSAKTELIPSREHGYIIYQDYIPGITLGKYIRQNTDISPQIKSLIQDFSLKALHIYQNLGVTFDILGNPDGTSHETGWNTCTNIVVCPDETIKFVDTVDFSNSLLQSRFINNVLQCIVPGRRNRVITLMDLCYKSGKL